jgi:hypothetical protein
MGLLMLSIYSCCMYWQEEGEKEGGCWGQVRGIKRGLLTLRKDTARMGIRSYVQGATIPRKRDFIYLQYHVQHCTLFVCPT